jgi:GDP-L-fucose synthase
MELPLSNYQANTQTMLSHINVGTGIDCTIRQLSKIIAEVSGFDGKLVFDTSKPDGTPRKLMDVSRIQALGWQAQISLEQGMMGTYSWYREYVLSARG